MPYLYQFSDLDQLRMQRVTNITCSLPLQAFYHVDGAFTRFQSLTFQLPLPSQFSLLQIVSSVLHWVLQVSKTLLNTSLFQGLYLRFLWLFFSVFSLTLPTSFLPTLFDLQDLQHFCSIPWHFSAYLSFLPYVSRVPKQAIHFELQALAYDQVRY